VPALETHVPRQTEVDLVAQGHQQLLVQFGGIKAALTVLQTRSQLLVLPYGTLQLPLLGIPGRDLFAHLVGEDVLQVIVGILVLGHNVGILQVGLGGRGMLLSLKLVGK